MCRGGDRELLTARHGAADQRFDAWSQRTAALRDQVGIPPCLDPVQIRDLRIRQPKAMLLHPVECLHALLATGDPQQALVGRAIPKPWNSGLRERLIEGATMDLLGLRKGAVDVEDQRTNMPHQILQPAAAQKQPGTERPS